MPAIDVAWPVIRWFRSKGVMMKTNDTPHAGGDRGSAAMVGQHAGIGRAGEASPDQPHSPPTGYSARIGGTYWDYELDGRMLRCSSRGKEGFSLNVMLDDPGICIAPARKFTTSFWVGVVGVGVPLWTFGAVYLKERRLDIGELGPSGYVHILFFIAGCVLLLFFRRRLHGYFISIGKAHGIALWRDPTAAAGFETFVSAIRARIRGQSA